MRKLRLYLLLPAFILVVNACGKKTVNWPDPYIAEISTDYEGKVVAGKAVCFDGANFSPVLEENKILYGVGLDAKSIEVTWASEDRLVIMAPDLGLNELKVRASVRGKESNEVVMEYIPDPEPGPEPPPVPTEFDPYKPSIDFAKMSGGSVTALADSVDWIHFHGQWEGQWRNIDIIRARMNAHNSFGIFFDYRTEGRLYVNEKAEYVDAIAGTNASMACCHYVRVNGEDKNGAGTGDYFVHNGAMIKYSGLLDIREIAGDAQAARYSSVVTDIGCGGPLLVMDGVIKTYPEETSADFLKNVHPRTAIGLSEDGKTVVQVTVDGRWTSSNTSQRAIGMTTPQLSKLMQGLGCYKALNLDGGGGTQMWIYGKGDKHNMVNHPHNSWPVYGTEPEEYYWIKDNEVARRTAGTLFYITSDLKR
ncbi:MAG: phosphodiester glycosidase family protein [Bacteroidales bacterium]|nr:phosphodiester glycosidase family protein [Bacteroidales bacterium]